MSRPVPAPSRPVPTCHKTIAPTTRVVLTDGERWVYPIAETCCGSLCTAFARVPSPVDPLVRQGVCGLVGGKCEPWPDTAPVVGEVGGE